RRRRHGGCRREGRGDALGHGQARRAHDRHRAGGPRRDPPRFSRLRPPAHRAGVPRAAQRALLPQGRPRRGLAARRRGRNPGCGVRSAFAAAAGRRGRGPRARQMTLQPVLVTGAGGFIGRALVGRLRAAGAEVVRVRDLARDPVWDGAARRCGGMVHLANIAHARVDRAELERVNVEGTRRLAEQALAAGVRRFVYVSSIKVHGNESPAGGFSAASAIDPADAYGETKARAERALRELEAQGLQLTILRPPLVYGASVRANFLALARAVDRRLPLPLASVRNRRSLVYVGNLADAIVRCLETPASVGRAYP